MQTQLEPRIRKRRAEGEEAEAILRKCVHCGFCNATCPTYQLLGDELDGPRGRIYLIKQVLEGAESTAQHAAAPGPLPDLPQLRDHLPERRANTGAWSTSAATSSIERVRAAAGGAGDALAAQGGADLAAVRAGDAAGRLLRPLLPAAPAAARFRRAPTGATAAAPARSRRRCPPPARAASADAGGLRAAGNAPNINRATARVLEAAGIDAVSAPGPAAAARSRHHLSDRDGGLADMRRNIDAWWPLVSDGEVEAIVINASGCGVASRSMATRWRAIPPTRTRPRASARWRAICRSCCRNRAGCSRRKRARRRRRAALAFHTPCTLQHGQRLRGGVEPYLHALGFRSCGGSAHEAHLCCGSAGTYSVLQPELAHRAARPQTRGTRGARARLHRLGQHRLHPASAERHRRRRCGTGLKSSIRP